MAEKTEKDHEPWIPKIDGKQLFINSADYERGLGEGSSPANIELSDEPPEEASGDAALGIPDPAMKPAG
jgi:hypothetical protein